MAPYADAEDLATAWLKNVLGYKNVTHEVPTNLVDLLRTDPVVVAERFGGADDIITLDVARLDVDVFANSRDGAKHHSALILAAMRTRMAGYRYGGTVVGKVATVSAPTHAAWDSRNAVRRFLFSVQLHLHQYTGVS